MFSEDQLLYLITHIAAFCRRVATLPGVDLCKIAFTLPLEICGKHVVIEETPSTVAVKYPEFTHDFKGKPSENILAAAIKAYERISKEEQDHKTASGLVASMADEGHVYVKDMPSRIVDLFLDMWSDAYGEDCPEKFVEEHPLYGGNETSITGFIKTRLSRKEIAARKNENGDDNYKPAPMFPKI